MYLVGILYGLDNIQPELSKTDYMVSAELPYSLIKPYEILPHQLTTGITEEGNLSARIGEESHF